MYNLIADSKCILCIVFSIYLILISESFRTGIHFCADGQKYVYYMIRSIDSHEELNLHMLFVVIGRVLILLRIL